MQRRTPRYGSTWRRIAIVCTALILMGLTYIQRHNRYESAGPWLMLAFLVIVAVSIVVSVVSIIRLIMRLAGDMRR